MAARAMWKADIVVDSLRIPIKLFAAVQDTAIHFRLLHEADMLPVVQKMVDPRTNKPVEKEDVRKGIEVERGVYVIVTPEDEIALEPEESREIIVEQVIPNAVVDDRWFDRPYFLDPEGNNENYFALIQALSETKQIAIARWTMRKQQYTGALHPADGYLMLQTLRHAEELLQIDALRVPPNREPDKREIALAEQLVTALKDEFDLSAFRDEYRDQVKELIDLKSRGKVINLPKKRAPKKEQSLLESLEASVKGTRKSRAS